MTPIDPRPRESCLWDAAALGEVMLRLDPGEGRIRTARTFHVNEGGGEYNVVRGLSRCFRMKTTVVTGIVDNEVGHLLEELMLAGGVDLSHVKWMPFDGIGRNARVGLNFTERGFGIRAAKGTSDRARSAASQLQISDVDWEMLFGEEAVRWFHCGGIFTALSATTPQVALHAMRMAREHDTITSYDLNYRPSLWKDFGGKERAREVNRAIAPYVDVMIGNEEDFAAALGFDIEGTDDRLTSLNPKNFCRMIEKVVKEFPNLRAVATTLREATSASFNNWGAVLWYDGEFYHATKREGLQILDRVGGGDSFASGLIYGFLSGMDPQQCVEYGAAHGALAMTTPGDTSMATLEEVKKLVKGGSARIDR